MPNYNRNKLFIFLLTCFVCYIYHPQFAIGQTARATIFGTVTDQAGAPLEGVTIQLTQESTGLTRTVISQERGYFVMPLLAPGRYTATASFEGFKKEIRRGIILNVGEKAKLDFVLQVGSVEEEIVVNADASPIQSGSARGQVIDNRTMTGLPLNQREFLQLAQLAPGSVPPAPESRLSTQANSGINVNGAREAANNFLLDGVDNNDLFLNRFVVTPSIDAIQEFKLLSSTYDAEYGRSGGAQINVALKSGSNELHGSLFEFFRNSRLDAKNFFDLPDQKTPKFQRNQFGGSIGGPIRKYRSFYFLNFEGLRTRKAETRLSSVPTVDQKRGDFTGTGTLLRDPFTGLPFPGNKIPQNRIHPVGLAIAQLFPDPNRATQGQNFISSPIFRQRATQFNVKLDHKFIPSNSFYLRYSFLDDFQFSPYASKGPNIPGFGITVLDRGQNLAIGDTQIVTPNLVNDFRFGFNRLRREVFQENVGVDGLSKLGITGLRINERDFGFPAIILAGYEPLGDDPNIPIVRWTGTLHFTDSLSYQRGDQFLKFGGEIRHYLENGFNDLFSRGQLNFQPAFTGDALGDLLLGFPVLAISAVNDNPQALRTTAYNLFIQDDWRAHPKLTLNLGLRYEFNPPPVDADDRLVTFDIKARRLIRAGSEGVPRSGLDSDRNNLAPRFGLSWNVGDDGKLTIRSGYGIFYDSGTLIENSALYFNPPFFQLSLFFTRPPNLLSLTDPFAKGQALAPLPSPVTLERRFRTAYSQQWNLVVQRSFARVLTFEAGYVGSKGTNLVMKRNLNQPPPGPGQINTRRPIQGFSDILLVDSKAHSTYHAFQARLEKRHSEDLSLLASYTFSKAIDNSSSFLESKGDDNTPQDSFNIAAERGLSNFDVRHRLSLSFVYDLPPGAGRTLLTDEGRFLNALLSNWQLSAVITFQSGYPFTPRLSTDNSNTGNVGGFFAHDRPNVVGNPRLSNPAPDRFFATEAFAIPGRFSFGNAGRNILIGPGLNNFDVALLKNFSFAGTRRIQFRSEVFNMFNHPNFNLPESFVDNRATFGKILSAKPSRQIQFALKLLF